MTYHFDIEKFRRFSLLVGLFLIIFTLSGVEIDSPAKITPLGIPLKINNPDLIGFGLLICSIYCLLRYYIFGIVLGLHPRAARKHLLEGTLADGNNYAENIEKFRVLARQDIERYFPVLKPPRNITWDVKQVEKHFELTIKLSRIGRLFGLIHDLDYFLPIFVNLVAICLFLAK